MVKPRSLGVQVTQRLGSAFLAFLVVILLGATWLIRNAMETSRRQDIESVIAHYRGLVVEILEDFEKHGMRLRSQLEYDPTLLDPAGQWLRLKSYITSQILLDIYHQILISDANQHTLFRVSRAALPEQMSHENDKPVWYYSPEVGQLYLVLFQPILLTGGQPGHLVLFRPIDNGVLYRMTFPNTRLHLVWNDRVVASSEGETGQVLTRREGFFEDAEVLYHRQIQAFRSGALTGPQLVIDRRVESLFSIGQLAFAGLVGTGVAGLLLWLALGRWLRLVSQRLIAVHDASEIFAVRACLTPALEARLAWARAIDNDEINGVATALCDLIEAVVTHEQIRDMTEQTIRNNEARIRQITTVMAGGIYVIDTAGCLTFVNPEAERLLGWSAAELLGCKAHATFHHSRPNGAFFPARECPVYETLTDGKSHRSLTDFVIHRDGHFVPVSLSAVPILEDGVIRGVVTAFNDISDRLKVEEALRTSEAEYRTILATALDGFWLLDLNGHLLEVNEAYCRMSGYTRDELLTLAISDLEASELPEHVRGHIEKVMAIDGYDRFETYHRRQDGSLFETEVSMQYLSLRGGTMVVFIRDLSERRSAERQIRELLDFNQKIIDESTLGILVYQAGGVCLACNEAAARIAGTTREKLSRQDFRQIRALRKTPILETALLALESNTPKRCEAHLTWTGREVWIDSDFVPFQSGGQPCLLVLLNDVSQYRLAERALRESKQTAEEASRAKSEFLSNMSHEIRTPLNAIIGLTHLALDSDPPPQQRNYLKKIEISSCLLLGIINDILDFSKIEAGKLELDAIEFTLDEVLNDVASTLVYRANEKGLEMAVEVAPEVPARMMGDPMRLTQVLNNLVGNAIKFTGQGRIGVGVVGLEHRDGRVLLRFSVCDTGIGLEPQQIDRLFKPFMQADGSITRRFGGTGLGLTISKRLVERMGGEIGVNSLFGAGSEFWFTVSLPVATTAHSALPAADTHKKNVSALVGQRVLVVEDNDINQQVISEILKRAGLVVTLVDNGQQALDRLATEPFDAVLMDLHMPVMDGLEATRRIRRDPRFLHLPVIAMTAAAMTQDRQACLAAGMNDHIAKPISPPRLFAAILRCLGGELAICKENRIASASHPSFFLKPLPWLPGAELAQALDRLGGNRDLLFNLLQRFVLQFSDTGQTLRDLIGGGDLSAAHELTHQLKGISATLCLTDLAREATHADDALTTQMLPDNLPDLLEVLARTLEHVKSLDTEPKKPDRRWVPVDDEAIRNLLAKLRELLAEHGFVPSTLRQDIRQALAGSAFETPCEQLLQAVERFDYVKAQLALETLTIPP